MTITTALDRITHLIPTYLSPNLVGDGVWVCTPAETLPEQFRASQEERTAVYLTPHLNPLVRRTQPDHALRYLVTSYGVPIAWVTLDGRTHYADDPRTPGGYTSGPRYRAMLRHRNAVRAAWPARFALDPEDGEVTNRPAA
jgi:hypothetical protein